MVLCIQHLLFLCLLRKRLLPYYLRTFKNKFKRKYTLAWWKKKKRLSSIWGYLTYLKYFFTEYSFMPSICSWILEFKWSGKILVESVFLFSNCWLLCCFSQQISFLIWEMLASSIIRNVKNLKSHVWGIKADIIHAKYYKKWKSLEYYHRYNQKWRPWKNKLSVGRLEWREKYGNAGWQLSKNICS